MPSHLALILPSPPPINFSYSAGPGSGLLSPGVTEAAPGANWGGGVCAGKEGVISSHPPGTWDLGAGSCRAGPGPSTIPSPEDSLKNAEDWTPCNLQTWAGGCQKSKLAFGDITVYMQKEKAMAALHFPDWATP